MVAIIFLTDEMDVLFQDFLIKMDRDEQRHGADHRGRDTEAEADISCPALTHFTGETNDTCKGQL